MVVGGAFDSAGGVSARNIARWNGTAWSALASGMNRSIYSLATLRDGDLAAGGAFTTVNGAVSANFARLTTTCPASAVSYAPGCLSSGGTNTLTVTSLPWVGGTFAATAIGLPSSGLVLSITGFTSVSIPLIGLLSQGVPGCDTAVLPDFAEVLPSSGGTAQTQLLLPNSASLVGVQFFHQCLPVELDLSLTISAVARCRSAMVMTIGAF